MTAVTSAKTTAGVTDYTEIENLICKVLHEYPVRRAALFGSAARREMQTDSDVDIVVEFLPVRIGLRYFGLIEELKETLQRNIDLIELETVINSNRTRFKESVLSEMRIIYEREN